MDNLATVLGAAGLGLGKLVSLHVMADSPQTADGVRGQLAERLDATVRPAISSVVSPLPFAKVLLGVDAVAMGAEKGDAVTLGRCDAVAGDEACADFAVMPAGGAVYLSGQPDKSPLAEATTKSLTGFWTSSGN